ncbi:MAG: decarboxylating 6-phosphogluconate dehydrogenase, partial [Thermoplasmata archaeon]|nr:decarboxylating 6-phosphogluconate dehydrogenase [Thermoplasmata archaeon]
MELGMVGLGRMGGNMSTRLVRAGHRVVGYARRKEVVDAAAQSGVVAAYTLADLVRALQPPRAVWLMVPAGGPTDEALDALLGLLSPGDLILDGGNSYYKDTLARAARVKARGLRFLDVGTSGGIWGLTEGYSLMIGGEAADVAQLRPIFEALAPGTDAGWGHVGATGAGHFVKMVHNGIEYGMMESYAEGFAILGAKQEYALDLAKVGKIWQRGSVVRSWLLDLIARGLSQDPELSTIKGWVEDTGEGRWTVEAAIDESVPVPIIAES